MDTINVIVFGDASIPWSIWELHAFPNTPRGHANANAYFADRVNYISGRRFTEGEMAVITDKGVYVNDKNGFDARGKCVVICKSGIQTMEVKS